MKKTVSLLALGIIACLLLPARLAGQDIQTLPGKRVRTNAPVVAQAAVGQKVVRQAKVKKIGPRTAKQAAAARSAAPKAQVIKKAAGVKGLTIYGNVLFSMSWGYGGTDYGIYKFVPGTDTAPLLVVKGPEYEINGGGAFMDGLFRGVSYTYDWSIENITDLAYREFDMDTWLETDNSGRPVMDVSTVALCTAYDPVDKVTYGCFTNSAQTEFEIGYIDYKTMRRTTVSPAEIDFCAMACNKDGQLYGIGFDANLYKINKKTGALTLVGATGIGIDEYTQCAAFDNISGKLYWAAMLDDYTSGIFEVDPATAACTEVARFENCDEFGNIYIESAPYGVPAQIADLKATFAGASADGDVTFTIPTLTAQGEPLTGTVTYELLIDGNSTATGSAAPGEVVKKTVNLTQGSHMFVVMLSNGAGTGMRNSTTAWVGNDAPAAPSDVSLSINTKTMKATLSWNAPETTAHGGWADLSDLTYTIVRQPEGVTVKENYAADVFSETLTNNIITGYWYEVYATSGGMKGEAGASNKVEAGSVYGVPYSEEFNNGIDEWTIVDSDADGKVWTFSSRKNYVYMDTYSSGCDDWIISPPIMLYKDYEYNLTFNAWSGSPGNPDNMAVAYGEGLNPATYTELMAMQEITTKQGEYTTLKLQPAKDGEVHIAFHSKVDGERWMLMLDDISMTKSASTGAPAAVSDAVVIPGDKGAMSATVSFTAPSTNVIGGNLEQISKIEVKSGEKVLHTFGTPAPGGKLQYVDNNPLYGVNVYTIVAYAGTEAGLPAQASAFIGVDIPAMPTNVVLYDNLDGTARLSWDDPGSVGENGGYVDPATRTFNIYYFDKNNEFKVEAANITGLSYNVGGIPQSGAQAPHYYLVSAETPDGESEAEYSTIVVSGTPYELPFSETFSNAKLDNDFWLASRTTDRGFTLTTDGGATDVLGRAVFSGVFGAEASLSTAKLSLGDAVNPTLGFSYYAIPGRKATLIVSAEVNGQKIEELTTIEHADLTGDEGWRKCVIDLSKYKGCKYIRFDFRGIIRDNIVPVIIDEIYVRDIVDYDLEARLVAPVSIGAGKDIKLAVYVNNIGAKSVAAGTYKVNLSVDGNVAESQDGVAIEANSGEVFNFAIPTTMATADKLNVYAEVEYASDCNADNNTTETMPVAVRKPSYPAVANLTATTADGKVDLAWSAPELSGATITESFEDLESFIIDDMGLWSVYDKDQAVTTPFNGLSFPTMGQPFAYVVFNPAAAGINLAASPHRAAHSGNQYLASICSYPGPNDDWLISPRLDGRKQTISMWARSWSDNGLEDFEILYSTTGADPSEFTMISSNMAPADKWEEFTAELPQGTTYFAVRCTSYDKNVFMLDDITYQGASYEISSYNIYRDGVKIGNTPAGSTAYTDAVSTGEAHKYNVTVVYNFGESNLSNTVQSLVTGIADASLAAAKVKVVKGGITVTGAAGHKVAIYSATGQNVYGGIAGNRLDVNVAGGVYVVAIDGKAIKVMVK